MAQFFGWKTLIVLLSPGSSEAPSPRQDPMIFDDPTAEHCEVIVSFLT